MLCLSNLKLVIEYDGTNYHGWQVQKSQKLRVKSQDEPLTIQGVLEEKLSQITKEPIRVIGAGRTDAGAHAYGQVTNFNTKSRMDPQEFQRALNSMLPEDIVIRQASYAREDFHAQFGAIRKHYRYVIYQGPFHLPFLRDYALYVPNDLNIKNMRAAAKYLRGRHDFSSFSRQRRASLASLRGRSGPKAGLSGSSVKDSVRTITRLSIISHRGRRLPLDFARGKSIASCHLPNGRFIFIDCVADGFLRGMVRAIAGTLLEVGRGKIHPYRAREILEAKDRRLAGPTISAKGLYLVSINY
jgi:tRNA pseudouridine38-40 synthase